MCSSAVRRRGRRAATEGRFLRLRAADGFDRKRLDDQRTIRQQKTVARTISGFEGGQCCRGVGKGHHQRGVGAGVAQMDARDDADAFGRNVLPQHFTTRRHRKVYQQIVETQTVLFTELHLDRLLAHRRDIGQPHAIGRQHTGQRVYVDARHAQRVGDQAGVLAAGAAKAGQCVLRDIMAALHRNLADRIGHVGDGDFDKAGGDCLGAARFAGCCGDLVCECGEFFVDHSDVEREVALCAEHRWEIGRLDFAEQNIAVGDG